MAKNNLNVKLWLIRKHKQNRRVPVFIVAKSRRKARNNPKQRNWRTDKLGTKNIRKQYKG